MRRVETGDPRRIEYRSGGGARIPFGLVLAGIAAGLAILGVREEATPLVAAGALFLACGLFIALGRAVLEIDLDARRYRSWWGLPFPIVVREGAIGEDARVSLSREIRRRKNHTYTVFPVRLEADRRFTFTVPRSHERARSEAESHARALDLPLVDRSTGEDVVRAPDRLDESLRDRVSREGGLVDPGTPPPGMLSTIETAGRTIHIHIPPRGFSRGLLVALIPLAIFDVAFVIFLLALFERNPGGPPPAVILAVVVVFLAVPLAVVSSMLVRSSRAVCTVEASPEVLRVACGPRGKVVEIPSKSLEDLDIAKVSEPEAGRAAAGFPIVARSDQARVAFGQHLPEAEKTWILQVLKQVLTA